MTDEEINIAIAEVCGWKPEHYAEKCDGVNIVRCGACGRYGHSSCYGNGSGAISFTCKISPCCEEATPLNYCEDLNAMNYAESILTDDQKWEQTKIIVIYKQQANGFPMLSRSESLKLHSATARQRAEAFLRTLGKWKEAK